MNADRRNRLDVNRRAELLGEFAELRPMGFVEFPGGEVTLALNELCKLARIADQLRLRAGVVTNGSTIRVPLVARRLVQSGLERISVSLDSHRPSVHDYVRGVEGAFHQATSALRLLLAARRYRGRLRGGPLIQVVAVVFDRNVHELGELVELCRSLGVDQVNFQLLNRTFGNQHSARDVFFEQHFWHAADSKRRAVSALRQVVTRYAADPILRTKPRDLERLEQSILSEHLGLYAHCEAHLRNVIVDSDGDVSLCFNHPEGATNPSLGNVANRRLSEVLAGSRALQMRKLISACCKPCGGLECHREGNAS